MEYLQGFVDNSKNAGLLYDDEEQELKDHPAFQEIVDGVWR